MRFLSTIALVLLVGGTALAQRDLKDIPDPDPELERKSFVVADGFEVSLFAADPKIAKPIHMNFDADGRLWIASSETYPHIKPGERATDKILVLEDADQDGRADSTTVFAEGLLIPTGVLPGDGGVYVANSTELIHLRDTDGDGAADRKQIVLSGFGTEDTHHLLHTLRWGPDGAMYMNQSIYIHSHVETPYGVKHLNGGGVWRFRPDTLELEVMCRGFVNPWGHHFDDWGQSFCTDGAYGEGINYMFPGAIYVTAPGESRRLLGLNPGSPKHCGLEILSGSHLPESWRGSMITNDFRGHRVCRFVVSEDNAGYVSRQQEEVIKSSHVAFRPIDVKMGPDGAIYIADWYNPIIQHGEVDFRDPRRDHVHGRIWRVTAKGRPLIKHKKLSTASTPELLENLKSEEKWVRTWSKLVLKSRGKQQVEPELNRWLSMIDTTTAESSHHQLEALWLCDAMGISKFDLLDELLASGDHRIRAAAIRVASHWRLAFDSYELFASAVHDEHPRVRLEAVRALSQFESKSAAPDALAALDYPQDRFLDFAIWQAARDLKPYWFPQLASGENVFGDKTEHLVFALKAINSPDVAAPLMKLVAAADTAPEKRTELAVLAATLGGPKELAQLFALAQGELAATDRAVILTSLAAAASERKAIPVGDLKPIIKLFDAAEREVRVAALKTAGAWKLAEAKSAILATAKDQNQTVAIRFAAIESLGSLGGADSVAELKQLAQDQTDKAIAVQAVAALSNINLNQGAAQTVDLLKSATPQTDISELLQPILVKQRGPQVLTAALQNASIAADVAKRVIRTVQTSGRQTPELLAALRTAGSIEQASWKNITPDERNAIVADAKSKGDPARGEVVYRLNEMQCLNCHAIGGAGGRVGPDLVSIGGSAQVDYLLDSLIDPNAKIKENFHSTILQTDEGKVVTGIPIGETDTAIIVRDAKDQEVSVPIDSIEVRKDGPSLMPEGLVDSLTRQELVDLVRFLSELGRTPPYSIANSNFARRYEQLTWTQQAHRRFNRTSFDTAASDDSALTWAPAYARVAGDLPTDNLAPFSPFNGISPTAFVRTQFAVSKPGSVKLKLNLTESEGITLWLDGKPVTPAETLHLEGLASGDHTLTIGINKNLQSAPIRIEMLSGGDANAAWAAGK